MIQVVAGRKGFVFTKPPILLPESGNVFTDYESALSVLPPEERYNLYYTLAHHSGVEGARVPQRTAGTFSHQTVVAFDIDYCDTTRPRDYLEIVCSVLQLPVETAIQVCSGNGFQFIFNLKNPIRRSEYFKENKPYYNEILNQIKQKMMNIGLAGDPDPVIFEPARVMRFPGTINRKPDLADKVSAVLQNSDAIVEIDFKTLAGLGDIESDNVTPMEIKRFYPLPDFETIFTSCEFMKWCFNSPSELHEPHVFDLYSLLGNMPTGVKVVHEDKEMDAIQLGKWIYENASGSKSLARMPFESKWGQATRYGCRKCSTIDERWDNQCSKCPFYGKVPTPLAIKGEEHISSQENGFWVVNKKGSYISPHYYDLCKVYNKEQPTISIEGGRVLHYKNGYYQETSELQIKGWIERRVIPNEPLREMHRREFVHKITSHGILTPDMYEAIFGHNLRGKLNLRNGVLDILKGEFLPHNPNYGFTYRLEYDYNPDIQSEFFMEWLSTITCHRVEYMETILDVMAYCLWDGYEDHLFTYFTGSGANGKSTIIEIIQAIIGPQNFSTMSLDRLVNNRFAPAGLFGKMVNLSEESSGGKIDSLQINTLKNLSSGGTITVERKGEGAFDMRNKAKLIFSANTNPVFTEHSDAFTRRLLVIPFDYKIENRDANVGKRLCTVEIPGILNILINRIKDNVTQNQGKFIVNRHLEVTKNAQDEFLMTGNSVCEWFKERVESGSHLSEDDYISNNEAYSNYKMWCVENCFKQFNNVWFGKIMAKLISSTSGMKVKKIDGKAIRVITRTRFKDEV